MSETYILDDKGVPVKVSLLEWGAWMGNPDNGKQVAREEIGGIRVSTVFLGLDHNYGDGPPTLYETMIFGGEHDEYQTRCETKEQALKMHQVAVSLVSKKGDTEGKR